MQNKAEQTVGGKLDEFQLRDELRKLRTRIPDEPQLNPILNVAFDLSRRLESGGMSIEDIKGLAKRLSDRACVRRARGMRQRVGYVDHASTIKDFTEYVAKTAEEAGTGKDGLAAFEARWARARSGIVFTAHPTFGLSEALSKRMIEIGFAQEAAPDTVVGHRHRPDNDINLGYEHRMVQESIVSLRNAYVELANGFFSTAAARYGEGAYKLKPKLATVASWVGYDLDGRTDIKWNYSFLLKLQEKRASLVDIRDRFLIMKHRIGEGEQITRISRQITGKLDLAIAATEDRIRAIEPIVSGGGKLAFAANEITKGDGYNLVTIEPLTSLLDQLIDAVDQPQYKRQVASLRALIEATGLGSSHIHVRVNALQVNNAFRAYVHESWTKDLTERQALARIVEMIKSVTPESVNFESLELETATAIRQFALVAQIHKHVDRETPIRYLIAECESPATILIAVFFAKLFGVDHVTDVSPLFETPSGLESGTRLVERLLEEETYRNYVKGRGRLSLQTGFSDAGRFIGQISATLAIERLQQGIAELLKTKGVPGTELLLYSTHGESMGRGTHPGDLATRLRYVFSSESRRRFARNGQAVKHETSFQGGDGYLYFANKELTTRALATVIMDGSVPAEDNDPFYVYQNFSLDFFLRLRDYQQELFAHPGYRAVLGAFGPNLLFKTGSRPVKRQMEGMSAADRGDPARMRAIPNNAILQQFGYVANVVAGLGEAVGSERERFVELAKRSPRLQILLAMVARGKQLSSLNAMGANATMFDAGFWASRASWGREAHLQSAFRALSTFLIADNRSEQIHMLVHHLRLDAIDLHSILEDVGLEGGKIPDDDRLELDLLQAVRLALIMRIFILAAQQPKFSMQNDLSPDQLLAKALSLDVLEVVAFMRQAFPHRVGMGTDAGAFDEPASYRPRGIDDYGRIETEILKPMEEAYEMVREIGTGISHHFGAFG
ncbi:MAG: phosphoenolpyruvate carboxylase [Hyphomicrobium sp.]